MKPNNIYASLEHIGFIKELIQDSNFYTVQVDEIIISVNVLGNLNDFILSVCLCYNDNIIPLTSCNSVIKLENLLSSIK